MAKKNLYINNTNLGTYGVYISSDTVLNAPSFDYVEHQVPGRDGTMLQYNNRLNNVVRKFTCYVPESGNVSTAIANVKKLIYMNPGYVKLSSDYESGTYQYGYFAQGFNVEPFKDYSSVTFDLYFSCQPYKIKTSVNDTLTINVASGGVLLPIKRSDPLMQQILNDVSSDSVPDEDNFVLFAVGSNITGTLNITSYLFSNTNFMAAIALDEDYAHPWDISTADYVEMIGYDVNGRLDVSNFTTTGYLYFICPIGEQSAIVNVNGTEYTKDFINLTKTTQVLGAVHLGIPKIEIKYELGSNLISAYENNTLILWGVDGTKRTWLGRIKMDYSLVPQSVLDNIWNNYWVDEGGLLHYFVLTLETDTMKCYIENGSLKLPMDSYVEIDGSFSGDGDTFVTASYETNATGKIHKVTVYQNWSVL